MVQCRGDLAPTSLKGPKFVARTVYVYIVENFAIDIESVQNFEVFY